MTERSSGRVAASYVPDATTVSSHLREHLVDLRHWMPYALAPLMSPGVVIRADLDVAAPRPPTASTTPMPVRLVARTSVFSIRLRRGPLKRTPDEQGPTRNQHTHAGPPIQGTGASGLDCCCGRADRDGSVAVFPALPMRA